VLIMSRADHAALDRGDRTLEWDCRSAFWAAVGGGAEIVAAMGAKIEEGAAFDFTAGAAG